MQPSAVFSVFRVFAMTTQFCELDGKILSGAKSVYNRLEDKHKSQKHRVKRFFYIIRDLFDEAHTDRSKFKKRNTFRRRL